MAKNKTATIPLEYVNYIQRSPTQPGELYQTACGRDGVTVDAWRDTWLNQFKANHAKYGPFKDKSIGKLFNHFKGKPVIIAGSGPSLVRNGLELKKKGDIGLISCLHNFHFMEDNDIKVDFYVSLDAGDVTVSEVSEGGKKTEDEYWELTKDRTLLCYAGTHPRLLEKWQGKVYFFNCPMSDLMLDAEMDKTEVFRSYISSGGNVLGACLYIAKAVMGSPVNIFVGADFAFSYDKKFHGWDSRYDRNIGQVQRTVDVYGNKIYTWPSYHGFKCFFDHVAENVPGIYINATEGGCFGAYPEGNIMSVRQMDLDDCIQMFNLNEAVRESFENPDTKVKTVLY